MGRDSTSSPLRSEDLTKCPACSGEITFMFGLGGGVDEEGNPGVYWICLDCDWQAPRPQHTVCFPFGIVERSGA